MTEATIPTRPMTERQREIFDFIIKFRLDKGYSPTMVDIAEHFDFRSANAAFDHVEAIIDKGYLVRTPGLSRSLRPTGVIAE